MLFFCRNGRVNSGLAPRRLQSRTFKSAPSPPRIAKPEFPSPIFGKKCRLFGKVLALLLGGFSHGHSSPLLLHLVSQNPNFPRPFSAKSVGCLAKYWPCSSAASVTDIQVRSFATSCRKTRISLAPFGKKCRSSGWVPVGFSHGRAAPAGTVHCAMSILRAGLTGHTGNTGNGTWHRVCHIPSKCQSTWLSVSFVPLP